nr:FmdB family zinc ribbon protein [Paenalcaligenes hominis]
MPIYDYFCSSCFQTSSRFLPISQRHNPSPCPHCSKGQLQLQITAPRSLQFKDSPSRALTPQQQLAGPKLQGRVCRQVYAVLFYIIAKARPVQFAPPPKFQLLYN